MVHRPLAVSAIIAVVASLALAGAADAANRRIAISDYRWSAEDVRIDLGEHVTWYWTGPDTMHSVTGDSPASAGLDSDAGKNIPDHPVGDSFQLSFDHPGTYSFTCKLHSSVRGMVTVSDVPGDPVAEPDPVPANRVDLRAPRPRNLRLAKRRFSGRGTQLHFDLGERGKLDADYYRLRRHGRQFAGWARWSAYVGENEVRFGARGKHFDAAPGRYVAELRSTDRSHNTGKPRRMRFEIVRRG